MSADTVGEWFKQTPVGDDRQGRVRKTIQAFCLTQYPPRRHPYQTLRLRSNTTAAWVREFTSSFSKTRSR